MKCLLVVTRWSEVGALLPASGRPHLDLLLHCLGYSEMGMLELDQDTPFDPTAVDPDYQLILVQGGSSSRLRRSILSNLGLSLWLDENFPDRLRVVGAHQLDNEEGEPVGFAVSRRGRIFVFVEQQIWAVRHELSRAILAFQQEEKYSWRGRHAFCWLLEGDNPPDLSPFLGEMERSQWSIRTLPDGDAALLMPANLLGAESIKHLQTQLQGYLYALEPWPLEELLAHHLQETQQTVALAESCTAGLVAARLTAISGSSAYFTVGFATYSNQSKQQILHVPEALIQRFGAVSADVALAMARGAQREANSDLAVSVTGIAGPTGGSPEKPVGTVYFAAVNRHGMAIEHVGYFRGSREQIRYRASQTALHLLRRISRHHD